MPYEMSPQGGRPGGSGRGRLVLLPIVLAIAFAAFKYLTSPTVIDAETGKKIHVGFTDEQGEALGLQSFQEVLRTERVVQGGPATEMVVRVAQRLIKAVEKKQPDLKFDWKVSVVDSPQANAFCLPGGKIVVYTGILPITLNEDGLAVVMGHEIAHAVLRHGSQRMLKTDLLNAVMTGASAAVSLGDMNPDQQRAVMGALGAGAKYGMILPFSRGHESEADERGLIYAAAAGYNPQEAVAFWGRMGQNSGGQPPEFASTHPSHATRIEDLKQFMPKAIAEYEKNRILFQPQAQPQIRFQPAPR